MVIPNGALTQSAMPVTSKAVSESSVTCYDYSTFTPTLDCSDWCKHVFVYQGVELFREGILLLRTSPPDTLFTTLPKTRASLDMEPDDFLELCQACRKI